MNTPQERLTRTMFLLPLGEVHALVGGAVNARPVMSSGFSPGEKHWHGAAPTTAMTHIAIQENLDGKAVDWLEKVSDEQYQGKSQ
jgi:hypothetical protein